MTNLSSAVLLAFFSRQSGLSHIGQNFTHALDAKEEKPGMSEEELVASLNERLSKRMKKYGIEDDVDVLTVTGGKGSK